MNKSLEITIDALSVIGKGIAYLLFIVAMVKYIFFHPHPQESARDRCAEMYGMNEDYISECVWLLQNQPALLEED